MANYPEYQVTPMRDELLQAGFQQLLTPEEVDSALQKPGTTLLVVNSVCGCAAAGARPGVILALKEKALHFDHLVTVFAGMETEATQRARQYFEGAVPSSPQAAILKDGRLAHLMSRSSFLDRTPAAIAQELATAASSL